MQIKIKDKTSLTSPEKTAEILQKVLKNEDIIDQDKEHFWVIGIDSHNVIKYLELVSLGILNENLVHPREVFRLAIMKGVASIIVAHNHPSDVVEPSEADLTITERLKKVGEILGIEIVDHIIITKNNLFSFKEKGLI